MKINSVNYRVTCRSHDVAKILPNGVAYVIGHAHHECLLSGIYIEKKLTVRYREKVYC